MAAQPLDRDLAPGVYLEDVFLPPRASLLTGVPAFLGYAGLGAEAPVNVPQPLTLWPQFEKQFGPGPDGGFLGHAVHGFFENGGGVCYAVRLDDTASRLDALRRGLISLRTVDAVDLVCAPDIMKSSTLNPLGPGDVTDLQAEVLADCRQTGGRFAILDAVETSDPATVEAQRAALPSDDDGALYHPWLLRSLGTDSGPLYLPPCGHVAGVYARSDRQAGLARSPANMIIDGVLDLRARLTDEDIGWLYSKGVNCLRALPGRGIRVWGARTLSDDRAWQHVGARRVFLTVGRWAERFMAEVVFEPNDIRLWVRIMRELTAYLDSLFQRGALLGSTPDEAFFVKCDGETNPPEVMNAGLVVTVVGLALTAPAEFIFVRIIHGADGVSIQTAPATV